MFFCLSAQLVHDGTAITDAFIKLNVISEAKRRAARTLPSAHQREEAVRAKQQKNAMRKEIWLIPDSSFPVALPALKYV